MISVGALQGESAHGSSVSSTTFKGEDFKDDDDDGTMGVLTGRAFDRYDVESERFEGDIDAPLSPEEEQLLREIEREQREDEELDRDATTRAALLLSPLLMAASSEVVTSGDSGGSFFPPEQPTPEPRDYPKAHVEVTDEYDSDLDGEINEDDLQFGARDDKPIQPDEPPPESDPFLEENSEQKAIKEQSERKRRIVMIAVWVIAIALICTIIGVVVSQQNNRRRNAPTMPPTPRPTRLPTASPRPTITPHPTSLETPSPTNTPTRTPRTRSPSREPTPETLMPIPTNEPLEPTDAPIPGTLQPSGLTDLPTVFVPPTIAPSFSDEETERRADITAFIITVSGVLILLDPQSPQFRAYQWLMNDDPLQLMASDMPQFLQRYTLVSLYYATDGENSWETCGPPSGNTPCSNVIERFLSGAPECRWLGVTCNGGGEIEIINIRKSVCPSQWSRLCYMLIVLTLLGDR